MRKADKETLFTAKVCKTFEINDLPLTGDLTISTVEIPHEHGKHVHPMGYYYCECFISTYLKSLQSH